ncbi:MAG: beta-galactosidase, partial [Oscillospiraceae bacterium]|nr:beta-galactosidase [Oscillospiraceae bacterium]
MQNYPYGSVYKVTREDDAATIRRDFEMMRDSGMDTVVIWPPAYYWEEKTKDYPFATGKMILRLAQEIGLQVIMEMAGQLSVFEYIPDCEMKPEYYALTENGTREWAQPSFGFLNYFHPEVKEKICAFYHAAALAYRDEPALLAYDVFNETMFRSFDGYTMDAFRVWLQKKYGTIENLNAVWERTYTDFSQVDYDKHKWMSIMPRADYCAFRKASIGMILDPWCDAIRSVDAVHPLIADNIHSQLALCGSYDRPQDDYDLKRHVDEIGMSFYPKGVCGVMAPAMRHQVFSGYYNASQEEGFFISEMQTHIQALFNPTTAVRPWELKQWCYEAYASGAKGLIYWMWRPFSKGLQTMGRGLVDYRGRETPRLSMAKEFGEQFRKYGVLKPVRARVGIVYDPLCEDFQRAYTEAYGVDQQIYLTSIYGAYKMLFDRNIPCDMICMEEIEKYDAIILTNKIVLTCDEAEKLSQY